jgi:hemoglobin/transferrin/lactoferrin receptor protein
MAMSRVLVGILGFSAVLGVGQADEAPKATAPAAAPNGEMQTAAVEKVTVTATRQRRKVDEVPATVTVITDKEIEDNMASDVKDLVRFEPGVSVRAQPSRFSAAFASTGRDGNSSFNIRGLEGNRVLVQIDGVRVPDGFSFGPQAVGRGDYLDLDNLKSVEILRGPASALYGSDGVAGAVSFITKDPGDFLDEDQTLGGRVRASYASADDSWSEGVVLATQTESGQWQGLLAYTRRDAHETDNQGTNDRQDRFRTTPNPLDSEANTVFAKLLFVPDEGNRFRLTYEYFDRFIETDALSARGVTPPSPAVVNSVLGEDETERNRVTLDHRYSGDGFLSSAFWAVYYQEATTREFSAEDRAAPSSDRTREGLFDNAVWGVNVELQSEFSVGGIANSLVYGVDYSQTRQEGLRNGTVPTPPDFFPQKPFPDTDFMFFGAFIQDEISFMDGKLKFYPAVRYDAFEVDPTPSAIYPLPTIARQEDSHVSPKLGATYWPTQNFGLFANYAEGFKAPAPSQVNNGFTNAAQDYTSIPNANLKPETSETFEGGVRVRDIDFLGGLLAASATAFTGAYEDFIEQVVVSGDPIPTPGGATTVFQYINLSGVEISGFEARVDSRWESGLGLTLAFATAEGDQTTNGVTIPLATIDPWKVVGGLRFDDPNGVFGGQAIVTYAAEKDAGDINAGALCVSACFLTNDFTILDLTAYWNVTENATLRAGIFNVFDEDYIWWSDVRGLPLSSTNVSDAYTQPGRNASVSFIYRF